MSKKAGVDIESVDSVVRERISQADPDAVSESSGVFNSAMREGVPAYNNATSEKVIQGQNNSWIVLGRDRPGSKASGYGGKGHTHSGCIDLCAGRLGYRTKERDADDNRIYADPDFGSDAARVYISQKTDVDRNFNLVGGSIGNSATKSAVGIKADAVRIIGREGIKLVTRPDPKNSQGGEVKSVMGIDLIAGNDDSGLQPLVLGDNLVTCLNQLTDHITKLNGIVDSFLMIQMQFNAVSTAHFHQSPFGGLPTSPSIPMIPVGISTMLQHLLMTKMSIIMNKASLETFRANYITAGHNDGYILSRYNNLN